MIAIGHIAKTYGILPSEVTVRATAYDLMITDVYTTWQNYQSNPNEVSNYSAEDLQSIMERAKGGK
jgi:hypothetical protein